MKTNTIIIVVAVIALLGVGIFAMNQMQKPAADTAMEKTSTEQAMTTEDSSKGVMVGGALMTPDKDIVDNAVSSADHTTVVAAVKAAGLVETLKGAGPFTVFAPTNAAFEKLPAGTVESLLLSENKAKLTGILTYHVVPGAIRSSDLKDGMTVTTVNGQKITFTEKNGKWYINDTSMITIADVISSNGVTHVVDTVLLPK